ncbi:hypothetical protein MAPG_02925 [Magnaporthiopsis poae ATCC 64411]|uniref:Uncharacterized protein n=1 Tax=Magnaporthiopsis poae (strain ATCC 64411 / 73-15) TaxID=644358 RepID=A0A0C4DSP0_MAGP6|nr:hypothetical protein MAPG_02925 [Magnaporthiopsis poae ATCC 64411]
MDSNRTPRRATHQQQLNPNTLARLPFTSNVTNYTRQDQNFEKVPLGISTRANPTQGVPANGSGHYYPAQIAARDLKDDMSKM